MEQRNLKPSTVKPPASGLQPVLALLLSLFFHGLIAAGIALYFDYAPAPDQLAQLDLTSVELSFVETPDETAAVAPSAAPMPQAEPPKPPEQKIEPPPPTAMPTAEPTLPQADTTDLPKPSGPQEQFKTPLPEPTTGNSQPATKINAPPKPRRAIKPDYPRESRLCGEQGDVTLEIDVDAQGTVDDVRVTASSGFPLLDEAALKAARAARFAPAKAGGKAVPASVRLTLNFKLK